MEKYFKEIEDKVGVCLSIAKAAREKGLDPVSKVEIPIARSLAERVIGLISVKYPQLGQDVVKRIKELGGKHEGATKTFLRDWKVGFMMRILGTKGFLEWAVVGEEEGVRDLAVQAENIRDGAASQAWSRTASDERLHLERVKTEVLGMEAWESLPPTENQQPGWIL